MSAIRMYCQGCAWSSYVQPTPSANVTVCPKCFGSWFGNQPPQPIAPLDPMTPHDRSRAALPANIRKTLEESNLPVEVATAIADLCESRMRPEEASVVADDIQRWHDIGQYEYVGPAQSVHLEAGERAYVQYRPTGRWFIVLPDPGTPQPGVTYKQAEKAGIEKAARYCIEVLADNHPHAANYFRHAAVNIRSHAEFIDLSRQPQPSEGPK